MATERGRVEVNHVRTTIAGDSALARLIAGGPQHVRLEISDSLVLDGAGYEFVAESFSKRIEYRITGPELSDSEGSPDPMIRWMGTVRREVEDYVRRSR